LCIAGRGSERRKSTLIHISCGIIGSLQRQVEGDRVLELCGDCCRCATVK
jgi:hypothetical protein